MGPADVLVDELRARVTDVEEAMREHRATTGARIVGRRQVLAQSWRSLPTSVAPRRTLRPRFAGAAHVRVAALLAFKEFLAAYRHARLTWIAGGKVLFPPGTYWLARFAPVQVIPLPAA